MSPDKKTKCLYLLNMNENITLLKKMKQELDQLKYLLNSLSLFINRLPPYLLGADLSSFIDDIKYLCGYVDCMIKFEIQLLPESKDDF